jgi:hypothetical protein
VPGHLIEPLDRRNTAIFRWSKLATINTRFHGNFAFTDGVLTGGTVMRLDAPVQRRIRQSVGSLCIRLLRWAGSRRRTRPLHSCRRQSN